MNVAPFPAFNGIGCISSVERTFLSLCGIKFCPRQSFFVGIRKGLQVVWG